MYSSYVSFDVSVNHNICIYRQYGRVVNIWSNLNLTKNMKGAQMRFIVLPTKVLFLGGGVGEFAGSGAAKLSNAVGWTSISTARQVHRI